MSDLATKSFTARLRFVTVKTDDVERSARFRETGIKIISGGPDEPWVMVRDADGNEIVFER